MHPPEPPERSGASRPHRQKSSRWVAEVVVDQARYRLTGPHREPCPIGLPTSRIDLEGAEVTIGRRGSRDLRVDIDLGELTGDRAVSHHHARLVRTGRGRYDLIDVGSRNGTRLNGAGAPIPPNTRVELGNGDRIHVGGWTTIIIRAMETG